MKSLCWLPLTALLLFSAFLLFQPRAAAEVYQWDGGVSGYVQLSVTLDSHTDLIESGRSLSIVVRVTDAVGRPVQDATVSVLADGASATPSSGVTSLDGLFAFSYTASSNAERHMLVAVKAYKDGAIGGVAKMMVVVVPPAGLDIGQLPVVPTMFVTLLASIGVASTEVGRYGMFKFFVFPLYSRIRKEEVLDHFVRGQIYGYIRANPGIHFNMLRSSLKVNNGTLAHHLRTLEMQGFVKSRRDRVFKRFYPMDVSIPTEEGIRLSDLQTQILDMVHGGSGATQAEIAERLNVSQQAVSYNLRMMGREGKIMVERVGRERKYFVAERFLGIG